MMESYGGIIVERRQIFQNPFVSMPIIVLLNSLAMMWLGLEAHFQQSKPLLSGIFFLVVYIIVCELWQLVGRNMYYHRRQFAIGIYAMKVIISLVLILIVACQSRWTIGLLLLMYELFQALLYRNDFRYLTTPYFPLMNAFFKGFVINIVLSVGVPFQLTWNEISLYLVPFLIFFISGTVYQIMYNPKGKRTLYYMLFTIASLCIIVVMVVHAFSNAWIWLKLLLFIGYFLALLYIFKKTHTKRLEQEIFVALFTALSMMTCTFL